MRGLSSADERSREGRSSFALGRAVLPPGGWHGTQGDVAGVGGMGPGRAARGWAGPPGSVQCLPVFGLALHRADISWVYDIMYYVIIIKM